MSKNDEKHEEEFTVSDMSADWMPWNNGIRRRRKKDKNENQPQKTKSEKKQDKKEYRHIVFAQFLAMLPAILCVACAFAVMALIAYLWLK